LAAVHGIELNPSTPFIELAAFRQRWITVEIAAAKAHVAGRQALLGATCINLAGIINFLAEIVKRRALQRTISFGMEPKTKYRHPGRTGGWSRNLMRGAVEQIRKSPVARAETVLEKGR
jgi:hypothetical protein